MTSWRFCLLLMKNGVDPFCLLKVHPKITPRTSPTNSLPLLGISGGFDVFHSQGYQVGLMSSTLRGSRWVFHSQGYQVGLPLSEILGVPKKVVFWQFSALSRLPRMKIFRMKIRDKELHLSKFWRHLVNVKIVKIWHLNSRISCINQKKNFL